MDPNVSDLDTCPKFKHDEMMTNNQNLITEFYLILESDLIFRIKDSNNIRNIRTAS